LQPSNHNWHELEKELFMSTFKRMPLTIVKGKGLYVWDDYGKRYLDFVGGWAVDCLGHCPPVLVKAIKNQAETLIQTSNQFYTMPQIELADILVSNSCLDKVFFCNSGAEANEGAVKLARRYGKLKLNGAYQIISAESSFHGRTLAMVAATGQSKFQQPYIPLPDGFINVEYDNVEAIKFATNSKTCAVILEPVQGEGGVNIPHQDYLSEVKKWCEDNGILLILDEIQTGIGRLGTMFGYQLFNVEPDIMTLAKGLGGGVPIGAILAKSHAAVFTTGEHGSTYGGNPLCCAAGSAVLQYIISHDIVVQAQKSGDYLMLQLKNLQKQYTAIKQVRGLGLLIALVMNSNIADKLALDCLERGFLVNAVKPDILRFMPPLVVKNSEIDQAIDILKDVFRTEYDK
jgi:acetylornithine/N-succinyldiaminopimelate aminotransferase